MTGRQSEYTEARAHAICEHLANGESLRSICRKKGFPARETVTRWLEENPTFEAKYVRAREIGLDERADALKEEIAAEKDVQRARLLLEHGRWYLSKLAPKRYGDKTDVALSGLVTVVLGSHDDQV
jgi:hypothetical protein